MNTIKRQNRTLSNTNESLISVPTRAESAIKNVCEMGNL